MSFASQVEKFWNNLTGQAQEDRRTAQTNEYNYKAVQDTNQTNKSIADENLQYQRELQEYNAALQQQIFEREDTSYERTARDMMNAGLNPLTMQGTNGAGEAIAQSPLNNDFKAIAPQAIKGQTFSPLDSIQKLIGSTTSIAGAIGQVAQLGPQIDRLRLENERMRLENNVYAKTHGEKWIQDENTLHETNAAHYKREYEHKVQAGKYDSDNQYEQLATAIIDAFNGRYNDSISKAKENVINNVPILKDAFEYVEKDARENTMRQRAAEKGYTLYNGQTTTTVVPHLNKGYNTIKVYSNKGKLIDLYHVDYEGNIINPGTSVNNTETSHNSGKF